MEAMYPAWIYDWRSERRVVVTRPGSSGRSVPFVYDPDLGRFLPQHGDEGDVEPGSDQRGALEPGPAGLGGQALASAGDGRRKQPLRVTLLEKLDPRSPHYDVQLAIAEQVKGYERMRQAEAPPSYLFNHLTIGASLETISCYQRRWGGFKTPREFEKRHRVSDERFDRLVGSLVVSPHHQPIGRRNEVLTN